MKKTNISLIKIIKYIGLTLIGLLFIFSIEEILTISTKDIQIHLSIIGFFPILLAILFYLFSHALRALRLYSLTDNENLSFSKVLRFQFVANGVNLLIPFKLGEAFRVYIFSKIFKSVSLSITTLIVERAFDMFALFLITSFALLLSEQIEIGDIYYLYYPLLLICSGILIIITLGPSILVIINKRIIQKNNIKYTRALKIISRLLNEFDLLTSLVSKRIIFFLVITLLIWFFEIFTLITLFSDFSKDFDLMLILSAFIALSSLLPNGPLGVGGIHLAFNTINRLFSLDLAATSLAYIYSFLVLGAGILAPAIMQIIAQIKKNKKK